MGAQLGIEQKGINSNTMLLRFLLFTDFPSARLQGIFALDSAHYSCDEK